MSKFFQNFEEEKSEYHQKIVEITEKTDEKLSKKDQKIKELKQKIQDVVSSGKNFDKLFKKFMNELKKYTTVFENNQIPEYLNTFFNDSRINSSKPMTASVNEFTSQFRSEEQASASKNKLKAEKKEKGLDDILSIEDDEEKLRDLLKFLEYNTNTDKVPEVCFALYSIYSRKQDALNMIKSLEKIDFASELPYVKNIIRRLDVYLEKISNYVREDSSLSSVFVVFLSKLSESKVDIDKTVLEKRLLEIQYFTMNQAPENSHPLFLLLFKVRNNQMQAAIEYYREHEKIFDDSRASLQILSEFGMSCAHFSEYTLSFEVLKKCYNSGLKHLEIFIFCLCIILNQKVVGEEIFNKFLEIFKSLDTNSLLLPSFSEKLEASRAFYLLNIFDFKGCSNIIKKLTGIDATDSLRETVYTLASL